MTEADEASAGTPIRTHKEKESSFSLLGSHPDEVKILGEQLNEPCLKSSTRLVILISLALNKKLTFVDLLNLTGMGKGSLSNHLEKLESAGYAKIGSTMTFGRSRVTVEITEEGTKIYSNLMKTLLRIPADEETPVD